METFCKVTESAMAAGRMCQWPRGRVITWRIDQVPEEFSDAEYVGIVETACALWEAKSGVRLERTYNQSDIVLLTRRIDSEFGVLAEAELPCGNPVGRTFRLWMDTSEQWVNAQNPPARSMDALRVLAHELGHSLGLGHAPQGSANLMAPSVSSIRGPQQWDVDQAVARYGLPSATPGDDDPPPPEAGGAWIWFPGAKVR